MKKEPESNVADSSARVDFLFEEFFTFAKNDDRRSSDLREIGKRDVATIDHEASLGDAARLMRECHMGSVVVVREQEGKTIPIGILTDRDIVMSTTALGISPFDFLVADVMTEEVVTVQTNAPLTQVIELMKGHGIKRIPLVDEVGQLAGIITVADVIAFLSRELQALSQVYENQREMEKEKRRLVS